jgi:GT2 family glycosyltransferase
VVFVEDVFSPLIEDIRRGEGDVVAPRVEDEAGRLQDSARALPSPWTMVKRLLMPGYGSLAGLDDLPSRPDWIAGLFMLMPSEVFRHLGGMDERYFLYFEDVDFCCRARMASYRLFVNQQVAVVHEARRLSRRDPKYAAWHLRSAVRFFASEPYRKIRRLKRTKEAGAE